MTANVKSMNDELTEEEQALRARMTAFALTFHSMHYALGVKPWDAVELDAWANGPVVSPLDKIWPDMSLTRDSTTLPNADVSRVAEAGPLDRLPHQVTETNNRKVEPLAVAEVPEGEEKMVGVGRSSPETPSTHGRFRNDEPRCEIVASGRPVRKSHAG